MDGAPASADSTPAPDSRGEPGPEHRRARERGVNPIVYWLVRAVLQPFFHLYFRLSRIGREHIPTEGPVIFAANHRSFLDPFVIGTLMRRPIYYVAKRELFAAGRLQAWVLNALGAFPVDRGQGDAEMIATARAILDRGDCVLIFPEGTRTRRGPLGLPKRGVGRLALETGAPVVPLAVIGTERVRRGWRVRPHKVRIRVGSPLTFPRVETASPALARAVTERIWPCVALQWEWLGGTPPLRRAAVIGTADWGPPLAELLRRAGLAVELCPPGSSAAPLAHADLVCLAGPAAALPALLDADGPRIPSRAVVLVASSGLVPPLGTLPAAFVAERVAARAVARLAGAGKPAALSGDAVLRIAARDAGTARELVDVLRRAGLRAEQSTDLTGVELASCAAGAAAHAAVTARGAGGPATAGVAAGRVMAEVQRLATRQGGHLDSFAGAAATGELVAALEGAETTGSTSAPTVALLARRLDAEGVRAPALSALAAAAEGRLTSEELTRELRAGAGAARAA